MARGRTNWLQRLLFKTPLYKKADCGNFHAVWERLCFCNLNEHWDERHGGIRDLYTGDEYVRYIPPTACDKNDGLCFCPKCLAEMRALRGTGKVIPISEGQSLQQTEKPSSEVPFPEAQCLGSYKVDDEVVGIG